MIRLFLFVSPRLFPSPDLCRGEGRDLENEQATHSSVLWGDNKSLSLRRDITRQN